MEYISGACLCMIGYCVGCKCNLLDCPILVRCRRSSLFGKLTLGRTDSKADPRPLNNKAFQNDAITAIVEFCQATNYRAGPISAKILSNPTGKDFANIMVHLCQQLDATYTLGGKVEDEVTTLLKSLRYVLLPVVTTLR